MAFDCYHCHRQHYETRAIQDFDRNLRCQWIKNVNNYLNTKIYSYLETSGGQSSFLYLNVGNLDGEFFECDMEPMLKNFLRP